MRTRLFLLAFTLLMAGAAQAQCRKFAKKHCGDAMDGYISDGTLEGEQLFEGEWRTYNRTFYSGVVYRIVICVDEEVVEGTWFEIVDSNGKVFYSSKDHNNELQFDFEVDAGINMDVIVHMPDKPEERYFRKSGCTAVYIGYKP